MYTLIKSTEIFVSCTVGKNATLEQIWKKMRSLIREGHLPHCNAKLQVSNTILGGAPSVSVQ